MTATETITRQSMQNTGPDFIVAGVMKAGTTSIANYLDQHPEIFVPEVKEPHFFSQGMFVESYGGLKDVIADHSEYLNLYAQAKPGQLKGDFDPTTIAAEDAPERIAKLSPNAKLILVLRNPIDRAYSHYLMEVREQYEKRPFLEAIQEDYQAPNKKWDEAFLYLDLGFYSRQLRRFQARWKPQDILVLLYDDLARDTPGCIWKILHFLEVNDPNAPIDFAKRDNESGVPRSKLARWILARTELDAPPAAHLVSKPPGKLAEVCAEDFSHSRRVQAMPVEARDYLRKFYLEEIQELGKLINRDLSHWLR